MTLTSSQQNPQPVGQPIITNDPNVQYVPTGEIQYVPAGPVQYVPYGTTTQYVTQPYQYVQTSQVFTQPVVQQPVVQQPVVQQPVVQQPVVQQPQPILGGSRVEYIPYEVKEIQYDEVERTVIDKVAVQKRVLVPQTKTIVKTIPREKIITEYQAVEYQKEYIPRTVYDTVQEQVPVQRTEYIPVQKTEYVAQERTDYITQQKQVPRTEYDMVEYRVDRQPVQQQVAYQQVPVQQVPVISSQFIQQPLVYSQARVLSQNVQPPQYQQVQQQPVQQPVQQLPSNQHSVQL